MILLMYSISCNPGVDFNWFTTALSQDLCSISLIGDIILCSYHKDTLILQVQCLGEGLPTISTAPNDQVSDAALDKCILPDH
jgi:hypothetical protein